MLNLLKRYGIISLLFIFSLSSYNSFAQKTASPNEFPDLVEKVAPSVVNIRTTQKIDINQQNSLGPNMGDENFDDLFKWFFGQRPEQPQPRKELRKGKKTPPPPQANEDLQEVPRGTASGFILSEDGYIVTNHHVIDGADEIYVTLSDKREFKAKKIGSDKRTDIALLKINAKDLPKLNLGDSTKLRAGEWVLAIGSPFGFDNTVTAGIVSSKSRDTGEYFPFIQTDAAVNPGNSGGPLINMNGEVIGINSQIITRSGGYQGISLAIPMDEASKIINQLKKDGQVVRGWLGVGIAGVSKEIADQLGLPRKTPSTNGALVRQIDKNGPAAKSDLAVGDIITKFNDQSIEKSSDLPRLVGASKPGQQVNLTVWRQGKEKNISVTLGELSGDNPKKSPESKQSAGNTDLLDLLGLRLNNLPKDTTKKQEGVLVEETNGPAARVGIREGDIIVSINNQPVNSVKETTMLLNKHDRKKPLILLVLRDEEAQYVILNIPNTDINKKDDSSVE
jgi:serine protease Do